MLSIVAASLIAAPSITQARVREEYPIRAIREGKSGAVRMRLWLDTEGKVYRCEALQVFGDEIFGKEVCKPATKLKMNPAAAPNGDASYGMTTSLVRYMLRDKDGERVQAMREIADITLSRADLIGRELPDFEIVVHVQSDGRISHCEAKDGVQEVLAEPACLAAQEQGWARGTDASDNPIPYVTSLKVRIEAGSTF